MAHVIATPELMTVAAADLATIGSSLEETHRLAGPSILALSPAAADEVSVGVAQLFSEHAREYQTVALKAAEFQERLVENLTASSVAYASAEDVLSAWLRGLDYSIGSAIITALEIPAGITTQGTSLTSLIGTTTNALLGGLFVVAVVAVFLLIPLWLLLWGLELEFNKALTTLDSVFNVLRWLG